MIRVRVLGKTHLAQTLRTAASAKPELELISAEWPDVLAFVAHDIEDHTDERALCEVEDLFQQACNEHSTVVVVSQVLPGWMRERVDRPYARACNIFYQVDTIIVRGAVARTMYPERFIVGCADPDAPLPLPYQAYLAAHRCPVRLMSYESAELAKCAINYALAKQIETANFLAGVAEVVGADYADVEYALRGDARIGPHAYLRPGKPNQHLLRDVETLERLPKRLDIPARKLEPAS